MMEKRGLLTIALFAAAALLSYSSAFAVGAANGIKGSPHDFSSGVAFDNPSGEICTVCHAPHDHNIAAGRYTNGLAWNHAVSEATYTMYNEAWSGTIDGAVSAQPDGTAKLCLGCHDGTVALDSFGKYPGGADYMRDVNPNRIIPGFKDGDKLDLRGTHPISIVYDTNADNQLNPTSTTMGNSGTIADVLDNGKVQCSSCHDVHDRETASGTNLLRVAQTTQQGGLPSGLCRTCHKK